jgi:RNA polymerase sigma-70 factor (ECF subfamily)
MWDMDPQHDEHPDADAQRVALEFEEERPRLRALATRMLGSAVEADDAVQEAWLRLARTDAAAIDNLPAWLTTVVSRICLDLLRSRGARREASLEVDAAEPLRGEELAAGDPAREAELGDAVGAALLVVLDTLSPAERLAFVLHDLFGMPFEEVAAVLGRSPAAVRQLASRGRRRVREPERVPDADRSRQRRVVEAFLSASREGDLHGLLELLDPQARVRSDAAAAAMGSPALVEGRDATAEFFNGRARAARLVAIDGYAGAAWSLRGELKVAFGFTLTDAGRIAEIELVADPEVLAALDVSRLGPQRPRPEPGADSEA